MNNVEEDTSRGESIWTKEVKKYYSDVLKEMGLTVEWDISGDPRSCDITLNGFCNKHKNSKFIFLLGFTQVVRKIAYNTISTEFQWIYEGKNSEYITQGIRDFFKTTFELNGLETREDELKCS